MPTSPPKSQNPLKPPRIKPMPFGGGPGGGFKHFNASEVVTLADSRFLFCDNNIGTELFELQVTPEGQMALPIVPRPIEGIQPGAVDDLEGLALVEDGRNRFIFAIPSMSLKQRKKRRKKKTTRGKESPARNCLLRINIGDDDRLHAEVIPDFRSWLIEHAPELSKPARYLPDDGGLNIEALGWHPAQQTLLLGLRTPLIDSKPMVIRVRLNEVSGPWAINNLEMLPPITLAIDSSTDEQGIRSIDYDESRGAWLIVVGNSTSRSKAPFSLHLWDGNEQGAVRLFPDIRFGRKMRVEGVAHGTISSRGAIIFVDDAGGYRTVWDDDPRLQSHLYIS